MNVREYKKTLHRVFEAENTGFRIIYFGDCVSFSKKLGEYTTEIVYERNRKFQGLARRRSSFTIESFRKLILLLWDETIFQETENLLYFAASASILKYFRKIHPPYISVETESDISAFVVHLKKHICSLEQDFLIPHSDIYSLGNIIAKTHWTMLSVTRRRDQSWDEFGKRITIGSKYVFIAKMIVLYIAELYDDYEDWKQTFSDRMIELDSIKPWGSKYTGIEIKQAFDIVTARLESGTYQDQIEALRKIKYHENP